MSTDLLDQSVYGALYFATVMTTSFYGITCMQTFFYYVHYPNDPWRTKSFVAALWMLDTVHDALAITGAYKYIIAGIVNPASIADGVPELILQNIFTALVAIPTQGFFVYRAYAFSEKNVLVPLIWVPLAIYQLVSTLIYVGKVLYNAHGIHVVQLRVLGSDLLMDLSISCLSIGAVIDILIAFFMVFLFLRERTPNTSRSSVHILRRLTICAVNTGIWSATFALLTLILLHTYPRQSIYTVFGVPLSSIYCNTLLANLNARSYMSGSITTHIDLPLFSTTGGSSTDQSSKEARLIHASGCCEHHGRATPSDVNQAMESEVV